MPNEAYNYFPHLFYEAKNGWHPSSNDYFRVKEEIIAKDIRKYQLNPEQRQKALSLFESKLQSFIPTNITHFLFNLDKRKTWLQWVSPMMCCACNLEGFKKIENEHPNLLPLLPQIETKFWGDDNLFSFESWRKILPNENISNLPSCNFDKFERRGNFEFFRKMDFKSIQTCIPLLEQQGPLFEEFIEILRKVDNGKQLAPQMIVSCIARKPLRKILDIPSDPINPKLPHELIPRLIRAMNRDYKNNLNNRTDNYYSYNFDQILDYLKRSGEYRNLSDNKTTFSSLIQRCQQWHKNLALRAANPNLIWESGTNQTTINGVQFTALNSHAQLIVEDKRCSIASLPMPMIAIRGIAESIHCVALMME